MLVVLIRRVIRGRNIVGDSSTREGSLFDKDVRYEAIDDCGTDCGIRL